MRRSSEILKDLGFNSTAPHSTQESFLRHLTQTAKATSAQIVSINTEQNSADIQLSFDPEILGRQTKISRVANDPK